MLIINHSMRIRPSVWLHQIGEYKFFTCKLARLNWKAENYYMSISYVSLPLNRPISSIEPIKAGTKNSNNVTHGCRVCIKRFFFDKIHNWWKNPRFFPILIFFKTLSQFNFVSISAYFLTFDNIKVTFVFSASSDQFKY